MIKDSEMIDKTFGSWKVLKRGENLYNRAAYVCRCKCGKEKLINGNELRRAKTTKCHKCSKLELFNYKGKSFTEYREYSIYNGMIARCKKKCDSRYGGRGITVCDEWKKSFINFINDMGLRPSDNHSIDRIDNNKGYSKDNCRWTTIDIQNNKVYFLLTD